MKIYHSKYTKLLNIKMYDDQLKWLLTKNDHFPNFEFFKKVFRFFYEFD